MSSVARAERDERAVQPQLRELADRMFSRAAGAPLIGGNQVRLLEDGPENYYSGISSYVQALRAAAQDGVDVRLLVPNATDIPILKPFSRAGYRALLEAGIRVFEWNGTMLHAKTAVADGRWARVGSTNLNIASWLGNCELDAVIEDTGFLCSLSVIVAIFPRVLRLPAAALGLWGGLALLWRGIQLRRTSRRARAALGDKREELVNARRHAGRDAEGRS